MSGIFLMISHSCQVPFCPQTHCVSICVYQLSVKSIQKYVLPGFNLLYYNHNLTSKKLISCFISFSPWLI